MSTKALASTKGSRWYVRRVGNALCTREKTTRPTVTITQNVVSA